MSTNMPNLKQIGGGHRKNGQKFVDLMWNDPIAKLGTRAIKNIGHREGVAEYLGHKVEMQFLLIIT